MKLAFIGTGNMGGALARAAALEQGNELLLVNRHPEKAEKLRAEIGGSVTDHAGAVAAADLLFLGVKPVVLPGLCETLRPLLRAREDRPVIVSMAAGVPIRKLQEELGETLPVIRIMPNTPVAVGEGMILYSCSDEVREEETECFLQAMRHAGRFMKIEERLMEAGMAVSGCGRGGGLRAAEEGRDSDCGADGAGLGQIDPRKRQTSGRTEGRGLLPRRDDHPGRTRAGGQGLPLGGFRSGHGRV